MCGLFWFVLVCFFLCAKEQNMSSGQVVEADLQPYCSRSGPAEWDRLPKKDFSVTVGVVDDIQTPAHCLHVVLMIILVIRSV